MTENRPPIVVILGHVDHGKTSLLDALRKSNIVASEHGGITQNTRAFQVNNITFIDTPGHAAFAKMRQRGGKIADIAVLVVAANDGVQPQTKESIKTIKDSGIPMIVAINKIDLPDANIERIKSQLMDEQVLLEGFGGDTPMIEISAKTGKGLPELLEIISLVASMNPSQADPEGSLEWVVLESHIDPKRGFIATLIVKNGTLVEGQEKIKALLNMDGERVKTAGPGTPVQVLGLTITTPASPPKIGGDRGEVLKIILKADVEGTLEAIINSLPEDVGVLSSGTGDITESDVLLAQSTKAIIIGFSVKTPNSAARLAEIEKIKIRNFKIIYELLDDLQKLVEVILNPHLGEVILGKAEIKAEFKIDGVRVAGCKCIEGRIDKSDRIRIDETEVRLKSLRVGKSEALTVKTGGEFGAIFSPYIDFKVGQTIMAIANG